MRDDGIGLIPGVLFLCAVSLVFWYMIASTFLWAIDLPTVYQTLDGECVRVHDPDAIYSCHNKPAKYSIVWVK